MKLNKLKLNLRDLTATELIFYGDMLRYKAGKGLYLSGTNVYNTTEWVNLYSDIKLVSAANLPFSGTPVPEFEIINNNVVKFTLPNFLLSGYYDVIFCNPAGYFKMSSSVKGVPIIIN